MAGNPRKRALVAQLERRTRETFEDGDVHPAEQRTHLDYVCAWVESGRTMQKLAADLAQDARIELPSTMLGNYLRMTWPDATVRLDAAREIGAHAMLEDTLDIADTEDDAKRARNRIAVRQYVAGSWNPRTSPRRMEAAANMLSAGAQLLEALRARVPLSNNVTVKELDSIETIQSVPVATNNATRILPTPQPTTPQRVDMSQLSELL